MRQVVLYIKDNSGNYQLTEMFKDETITITSKLQDVRDISKVFTDFSQPFTIPASKGFSTFSPLLNLLNRNSASAGS